MPVVPSGLCDDAQSSHGMAGTFRLNVTCGLLTCTRRIQLSLPELNCTRMGTVPGKIRPWLGDTVMLTLPAMCRRMHLPSAWQRDAG